MANPRGRPKKDPDADFDVESAVAEAKAAAAAEDDGTALELQLATVARLRGKAEKDRSYGAAVSLFKEERDLIRRLRYERRAKRRAGDEEEG